MNILGKHLLDDSFPDFHAEDEAERIVMEERNRYLYSEAGMAQLLREIVESDGQNELAKELSALCRTSIGNTSSAALQMIARKNVVDCLDRWAEKIAGLL